MLLNRMNKRLTKVLAQNGVDCMLLKFTVSNFACFQGEAVINFYADTKLTWNDRVNAIETNGVTILRKCAIFGNNSTGKSYLTKALSVFLTTIFYGYIEYGSEASDILKTSIPYALKKDSKFIPSFFEIELLINGVIYKYGIETIRDKIFKEWLYKISDNQRNEELIFNNKYFDFILNNGKICFEKNLQLETNVFGNEGDMHIFDFVKRHFCIRDDMQTSFLSELTYNRWGLGLSIREYVKSTTINSSPEDSNSIDVINMIKNFYRSGCTTDDLFIYLNKLDDSIIDLDIKILQDSDDVDVDYEIILYRRIEGSSDKFGIRLEWESKGTRKYLFLLMDALICFKHGGALLVDEYDANLHPYVQNQFIELFENSSINIKNAQLILNSQNISLLSSCLFRPDELYLADRTMQGVSSVHSILSFYDEHEYNTLIKVNFEYEYNCGTYVNLPYFRNDINNVRG